MQAKGMAHRRPASEREPGVSQRPRTQRLSEQGKGPVVRETAGVRSRSHMVRSALSQEVDSVCRILGRDWRI